MKRYLSATVLFLSAVFAASAQSPEPATRLRKFEVDWLTAGLNGDPKWQQRFLHGKLDVTLADTDDARQRNADVADLLRTPLSANEIKVRIRGTISLLTSDPAQNRSFRFLDTFNKKNGKWQVIATSISAADATGSPATDRKQIEQELTRLENAWAQVNVTSDRSVFDRIIAPDFVSTSASGKVRNRDEWIRDWAYEDVKTATITDLTVHVYSGALAVVTGVDVTTRMKNAREVVHEDRFSDTWLNRDGQWQVIAAQVTRIK